jgi:hypothetical protein
MHHRRILATLAGGLFVLSSTACAPGADPAADPAPGGSRMKPKFEDRSGKDRRERGGKDAKESREGTPRPSSGATPAADASDGTTPDASTAPPTGAAGPALTRTSDQSGDVSGLGAPDYVDLVGAELRHEATTWTLTVTSRATLPQSTEGSSTMNVFGFFDTDLDGSLDHEIGASLADSGWGTSSRGPDGARFGSESGVRVTVEGRTLTFVFADALLDGAQGGLQWSVGAEYGTFEQVATGTTAQDLAPDQGGVTA